jgi:hypothetical protein
MGDQAVAVAVVSAAVSVAATVVCGARGALGGGVGSAAARGLHRDARTAELRLVAAMSALVAAGAAGAWLLGTMMPV